MLKLPIFKAPEGIDLHKLEPQDFNLYFQNSFVKMRFKNEKEFRWVWMVGFHPDGGSCVFKDSGIVKGLPSTLEGGATAVEIKNIELDLAFPATGAYNYKFTTLFLTRSHSRQWNKGFKRETAYLKDIMSIYKMDPVTRALLGAKWDKSFWHNVDTIRSLLTCKYSTVEKIYSLIAARKIYARAVDRDFVLSIGAKDKGVLAWFRQVPVGKFVHVRRFELFYPEFLEPLKSYLTEDTKVILRTGAADDEEKENVQDA